MVKLVTSIEQVTSNICNYPDFLKRSEELRNRTSQHRAWYAIKEGGAWCFGNSKIVGYFGLTPEEYLKGGFDGRQTEAVLQQWFVQVEQSDPLYEEIWEALAEFLSSYGKSPSKLARINVLAAEVRPSKKQHVDALCDLIVEVAKGLDPESIKIVRKRLKTLL